MILKYEYSFTVLVVSRVSYLSAQIDQVINPSLLSVRKIFIIKFSDHY